jgi:hypothetical protein
MMSPFIVPFSLLPCHFMPQHTTCLETWIASRPALPGDAPPDPADEEEDDDEEEAAIRALEEGNAPANVEAADVADAGAGGDDDDDNDDENYNDGVPRPVAAAVAAHAGGAAAPVPQPMNGVDTDLTCFSCAPRAMLPSPSDRRFVCEICLTPFRVALQEEFECSGTRCCHFSSICHLFELLIFGVAIYYVLWLWPLLVGAVDLFKVILFGSLLILGLSIVTGLGRWRSSNSKITIVAAPPAASAASPARAV